VYSAYRTSCTWYENPIVADVDGDFNSEIVIPSNSNCGITCPTLDPQFDGLRCQTDAECPDATTCGFEVVGDEVGRCRCEVDEDCGGNGYVCRDPIAGPSPEGKVCRAGHPGVDQRGIRVVRDALDRWVNSRPIWNQHAYSVTHVEDGGVCLPTDAWEQNWTVPGLNNFRQAIAGDPDTVVSPDLTGGGADFACNEQTGQATITTEICNRGTEPVGAGIPISFYEGEPEDGEVLCTATTTAILAPGECEAIPVRVGRSARRRPADRVDRRRRWRRGRRREQRVLRGQQPRAAGRARLHADRLGAHGRPRAGGRSPTAGR
jgi:hypothetical protein